MEIFVTPNQAKTGFTIPNDYQKSMLMTWLKKYELFKITPMVEESKESRGYLEGAVIPAYCKWQYEIDPREPGRADTRRFLFKRDFSSEVVTNRDGNPERVPTSTKGKARAVLDTYTRWAEENGAPIPNPKLYKTWKNEWSMDARFTSFYDWLQFLGIEEDAMPSEETLAVLRQKPSLPDYPEDYTPPTI